MATHDLWCVACGQRYDDVPIPAVIGARCFCAHAFCVLCAPEGHSLEPIPALRLSLFSDADPKSSPHDFAKSTHQIEDPASPTGYRTVTVSSLHDIRTLERESEQRERNGEGRRMVFRDYSQDHSNQFLHTLGSDPSLKPAKTFTNGQPVRLRKGDAVTADHGTIEE